MFGSQGLDELSCGSNAIFLHCRACFLVSRLPGLDLTFFGAVAGALAATARHRARVVLAGFARWNVGSRHWTLMRIDQLVNDVVALKESGHKAGGSLRLAVHG